MQERQIDISFLVVNYASRDLLPRLIHDIRESVHYSHEIIIVNNDAQDLDLTSEDVKVIDVGENIGFGRAHNRGAGVARGTFLCILNPDAYDMSHGFDRCIDLLEDSNVGIVAPRILDPSKNEQEWSFGYRNISPWSLILENLGIRAPRHKDQKFSQGVAWVTGAAFFISRELFVSINGFDEQFFLYYEDVDLCRRIRDRGYKIIRVEGHYVFHISGASSTNTKKQKEAYFISQDYYFRKHYGNVVAGGLRWMRRWFHV